MNKYLLWLTVATFLVGCAGTSKTLTESNQLKSKMVDKCVRLRRAGGEFNARKSYQLIYSECKQILSLDESFRRLDDARFIKSQFATYFGQQEDFDAEAWFMVTEIIRKKYYPDYLDPESEIVRANSLNDQQNKNIEDKSILRQWKPRLLAVSPYLMNGNELGWAGNAVDRLSYENRNNKELSAKYAVISAIIVRQKQKKGF